MTDEDGTLVARFLNGDTAAFDSLFAKYQSYVYNIIYGIVGSAEEARDLTQDVFVQVYRSLHGFRHGARFATWLYRIAANRAVDAARGSRHWRFLPLSEDPALAQRADPHDGPETAFARGAERDTVQAVLMRCPLHHREILVLRYYHDLSIEQIAEIVNCSVAAAKVRLHRARLVFKEHYLVTQGVETQQHRGKETRKPDADRTTH